MPNMFFEPPAQTNGTNKEQLEELHRYLLRMSEQLNDAMNAINIQQTGEVSSQNTVRLTRGATARTESQTESSKASEKAYNTLRSMIIKTASIIRSEMETITAQLTDEYTAISDEFGTLEERWTNTVEATAQGTIQTYDYDGKISGVQGDLDGYRKSTSQYIFMGIVDGGKAGIAIGNNVTNPDGTLNEQTKSMTLTDERLAFFVNGAEIAYFSNNMLVVSQIKATETMQIGSHVWRTLTNGALVLVVEQA